MELTYKITSYDSETDVATLDITLNGKSITKRANSVPVNDPKECDEFMKNWATSYLNGLKQEVVVSDELKDERTITS